MYKTIVLKRGKSESLKRFHPWIFSGAIMRLPDGLQEGETVRVTDYEGTFLAIGHYQIGSIAVRILTFREQPIDLSFWHRRLSQAFALRQTLGLIGGGGDIYRLVHGEGDRLPGLIIDIYGHTAVMQAHSVGMHTCRHEIAAALSEVAGGELSAIYYKSDT
ncbi:MAG: class I SAM-dependent rRNA methyltransferase, partial [Alloprevotella sp.]|nr:class I SAM-dependent rRNA methyltransferase [Alloprevotella sp.]